MNFLANEFFLQFGVPLIAVGLTIFVKFVTRNDAHTPFRKEDLAIGLDLSVTALLLFVTASSTIAKELIVNPTDPELLNKAQSVPWIIAAYLVGIWGVSTIIRKFGWEDDDKLKLFWGILAPGLFGITMLFLTVSWITQ